MHEKKSQEWKNKRPEKKKQYRHTSYLNNKESVLAVNERWRQQNKEKDKLDKLKSLLKRKYNLSYQEYLSIVARQHNVCAICHQPPDTKHKRLYVDHCHKTGNIRGLLCHGCNVGIGGLKDDPALLIKASEYVTRQY